MTSTPLPTSGPLPVLILHTGDPDESLLASHGSYAEMMRTAAGLSPDEVHIVRVFEDQIPLEPASYRAALITGSPAMVTDQEPWSERTADWIRRAAEQSLPMFGVCYGHQLLAHALGGKVDYNPRGRELGTHVIECLPDALHDPLLGAAPPQFSAQLVHAQSVTALPTGAVVLARSAMDPYQCVRLSPTIYSTQFHPEFDADFLHAHLLRYRKAYSREGLDIDALTAGLDKTPIAAGLLKRFLMLHNATSH